VYFLPFERLALFSEDPPEVVAARISAMVAAQRFYWTRPPHPFQGSVCGTHFKFVRVLGPLWRNSWRPVIVGDLVRVPGGTEVRVRMRLQWLVGVFTALWFAGWTAMAAAVVWSCLTRNPGSRGACGADGIALACGISLFFYLLVGASFWIEAKRARVLLCDRLACQIEVPRKRPPTS
jgi:hypothetical protein